MNNDCFAIILNIWKFREDKLEWCSIQINFWWDIPAFDYDLCIIHKEKHLLTTEDKDYIDNVVCHSIPERIKIVYIWTIEEDFHSQPTYLDSNR